jgi:hypothetical protein
MGRPRDRRSSHAAYRPKIVVGQSMKLGCFLPTVRDGKCAVPSEVTHHELGTEIGYGVDRAPKGLEGVQPVENGSLHRTPELHTATLAVRRGGRRSSVLGMYSMSIFYQANVAVEEVI